MVTATARLATGFAGVGAGLLADGLLGEPPAAWHPVAAFGRGMTRVERLLYRDRRMNGIAFAATGIGGAAAAGLLLRRRIPNLAVTTTTTYIAVAARSLREHADAVGRPLRGGDVQAARQHLPALVGRDPTGLDKREVARAVVESVAENTVDAIVAPALWAAAGGAPAVLAYRAINTLDAMVGHRSTRYNRFGWASARADDVANWAPARVTALLVASVRPWSAPRIWRAVRTQAPSHPSPNAGVAEAAFAAALGIRLGGTNSYDGRIEHRPTLGTGRDAAPSDIGRATRLSRDVTVALGTLALAAAVGSTRSPR